MKFTSSIPNNVRAPIAVSAYLTRRFTYHNETEWAKIIGDGRITVNGEPCRADSLVTGGDTIIYDPGEFEEPKADLSYSIIYEDDRIFAVNKPANLLVHRAGRSFRNNLVYQLRYVNTPTYPDCHPVHRLDRDTSGVVLIAKNSEEMRTFGKLFADGNVTKTYKAIVIGHPDFKTPFTIDAPISEDKRDGDARSRFKTDQTGKTAVTIINDIETIGDDLSLLTIRPLTGRTHQIRVHLAHTGHPIAGDNLYGGGDKRFAHQALHCESLEFIHPHTGKQCKITAEYAREIRYDLPFLRTTAAKANLVNVRKKIF